MHKLKLYHEKLSESEQKKKKNKKQMICEFHFAMPRQVTILIHQLHLWLKPLRAVNSWNTSFICFACLRFARKKNIISPLASISGAKE